MNHERENKMFYYNVLNILTAILKKGTLAALRLQVNLIQIRFLLKAHF